MNYRYPLNGPREWLARSLSHSKVENHDAGIKCPISSPQMDRSSHY